MKPDKPIISEDEILSHPFLTIEEVATLLRVSIRTVYNLIYRGKLTATKVSYQVTIIQRENFMNMINDNTYNKTAEMPVVKAKPQKSKKTASQPKPTAVSPSNIEERKGREEAEPTAVKADTASRKRELLPSSNYKASVRDSYVDVEDADMTIPSYTMAEICRKYKYSYGRFYALRLQYEIPCIRGCKPKRFPCADVDKAMAEEAARLCRDEKEKWLTCSDIMCQYGLGKTQVRRFAQTHGVRIRKACKNNYYLKADWEAARLKAAESSSSVKGKRPLGDA